MYFVLESKLCKRMSVVRLGQVSTPRFGSHLLSKQMACQPTRVPSLGVSRKDDAGTTVQQRHGGSWRRLWIWFPGHFSLVALWHWNLFPLQVLGWACFQLHARTNPLPIHPMADRPCTCQGLESPIARLFR